MTTAPLALYGTVPDGLIDLPAGCVQCSPQIPGGRPLSEWAPGSCGGLIVHAPATTIERRAVLAFALQALVDNAQMTAFAANTKGGARLKDELTEMGCAVTSSPKRRHQIATLRRPATVDGLSAAIEAAAPRQLPALGLWSQPGLFHWDGIDPGSQLLLAHLPTLTGRGADLGCGIGVLAKAVRAGRDQPAMTLIDIDCRALELAKRNVGGAHLDTVWTDVRRSAELPTGLDFVVSNPPFHAAGTEDKTLGQAFIVQASRMLKPGGTLWLTANAHLPYEATLKAHFDIVETKIQSGGYKIIMAQTAQSASRATARRVRS